MTVKNVMYNKVCQNPKSFFTFSRKSRSIEKYKFNTKTNNIYFIQISLKFRGFYIKALLKIFFKI